MSNFGGFERLNKRARRSNPVRPWMLSPFGIEREEVINPYEINTEEAETPFSVEWQADSLPGKNDNSFSSPEVMGYMDRAKRLGATGFILRDDLGDTVEFRFPEIP